MTEKLLDIKNHGQIAVVRLNRPQKHNALSDGLVLALRDAFENLASDIRAVVLAANGVHFSAGLDLSELTERNPGQGLLHSRMWHQALDAIQYGPAPVIAAVHGAVVGGGLELAAACHVRVADRSTYYALPEGARGIFVGGGGSVRIPKLIGTARMTDMMLTGRVYQAEEGERAGFAQYLVDAGQSLAKAMALAERVVQNAPLTNYAITQALPRIAEQAADHGYLTEALMTAVTQSAPEAKQRLRDFLEGRAARVRAA
jgi:enoyl-CoA hydratase/carnithine racemase